MMVARYSDKMLRSVDFLFQINTVTFAGEKPVGDCIK